MSQLKRTSPLPSFNRRTLFRGAMATGLAAGGMGLLTSCSGGGSASNVVRIGAYQGDEVPRRALTNMVNGFPGDVEARINFVDHETFKNNLNNYLQGNPDDIFTWFAGYRARFFADNDLVSDLSDIWANFQGFPESIKNASSTLDNRQVLVPSTYYPWAVFYRPSVWKARGYTEPKTKAEWLTLCEKIKGDGMTPLAFANKGGWEAMGTFDMLNLRVNGYDFHISLMAGEEAWDGEKVKNVFKAWGEFRPFEQPDANGRTWQEAAQAILNEQAAMMTIGMFIGQQFETTQFAEDLDFFIYPEFDPAIGADVVEAPLDGFMLARRPRNPEGSRAMLSYLATPEAVNITLQYDPSVIAANSLADQSSYSALQKKAVRTIEEAANISQFLDRDTRPDFASTVVGPALQSFIRNPNDIDRILLSVERQKQSIFG